jgi:dephospho-CoA kinase
MLGGIGAGKSHVAGRMADLAPGRVVDADALAHEALRTFARDGRLAESVGAEFVVDGQPDVAALGARAFNEPVLLRRLERLIHPYCHSAIKAAIIDHREGDGPPLLVLDVALLIEVGLDRHCDALWFVDVPDALRTERAGRRGLTFEQLQRREAFQSPMDRKRARADLVIRNDVDDAELDRQIIAGLESLGLGPLGQTGEGRHDLGGEAAVDPAATSPAHHPPEGSL